MSKSFQKLHNAFLRKSSAVLIVDFFKLYFNRITKQTEVYHLVYFWKNWCSKHL